MSREGGGGAEKTESSKKSGASESRRERHRHEGSAATQPSGTSRGGGAGTSHQAPAGEEQIASGGVEATVAEGQPTVHATSAGPPVAAAASLQVGATVSPEDTTAAADPSSVRPVIAVSASKGPAAFFNLARKFLVTEETCDLSALEGAIVSAVDAAHLLERSKLATITRIQTSYIAVEPKRKRQQTGAGEVAVTAEGASGVGSEPRAHGVSSMVAAHGSLAATPMFAPSRGGGIGVPQQQQHYQPPPSRRKSSQRAKGAPLRRARIVITVRRTEDYRRWLEENPHHQALIASGEGDIEGEEGGEEHDAEEEGAEEQRGESAEGRSRGRKLPPKAK